MELWGPVIDWGAYDVREGSGNGAACQGVGVCSRPLIPWRYSEGVPSITHILGLLEVESGGRGRSHAGLLRRIPWSKL